MKTMTMSDLLKQAMEDQDLNASEAAIRCGVSRQAFSLWLKEAYDPKLTPEKLRNISEFVGKKPEEVLRALGFLTGGWLPWMLDAA